MPKTDYKADLLQALNESGRNYNKELISKSYDVAFEAHKSQLRKSGESYITHPVETAKILIDLGMDSETIAAALLHDVVEDTEYTFSFIQKEFGSQIAELVDGVTKLGRIPYSTREEEQAENIRKMFLAMSNDIRVIIIKLADRLHNMRTVGFLPEQKRRDKAKETIEVFAPIAHRLGIRALKDELNDLALRQLDPVGCDEIERLISAGIKERTVRIEEIKEMISKRLADFNIKAHIEGRVKSVFSIYQKMFIQGRDFEEIYDIYAVRIITETNVECYNVLGIMHDMFKPIPRRFKDYISTPKPNMYQSLHTTVIGKDGIPFELQIRTWDMHYTAEYGIAAHWKYKEGIQGNDRLEEKLAWIRQVLESQSESEDADDIISTIKNDLASDEVFVFTPKGDVINLPVGSTVIDFAYAIHSAVGNRMIGAKVNGRIVPLTYKIKTGEIIEILTSSATNRGPSRDWLKIVKTSEARNKIRQWFKKERREENIVEGKNEIEREFKRNAIILSNEEYEEFISEIAKRQHFATVDDFYAAIGYGGIILSRILPRIKDDYLKQYRSTQTTDSLQTVKKRETSANGVIIEGIDNCLVKIARCCSPIPGDEIIGYITRGHGVSVHNINCSNVPKPVSSSFEPDRWVNARWSEGIKTYFKTTITLYCNNRPGLIADITNLLSKQRINIHGLIAREMKNNECVVNATIDAGNLEGLNNIIKKLSAVESVISVDRHSN